MCLKNRSFCETVQVIIKEANIVWRTKFRIFTGEAFQQCLLSGLWERNRPTKGIRDCDNFPSTKYKYINTLEISLEILRVSLPMAY